MQLLRFARRPVFSTAAAVRSGSTRDTLKLGGATPNFSNDVCGRQYLPPNRWFSWVVEPGILDELRDAAARIKNYVDWKREFLTLAENAVGQAHVLRAGFYFRAANLFMRTDDLDRRNARVQFFAVRPDQERCRHPAKCHLWQIMVR